MGKTPYPGMDPKAIVKMLDAGERISKPLNAACTDERYILVSLCYLELVKIVKFCQLLLDVELLE